MGVGRGGTVPPPQILIDDTFNVLVAGDLLVLFLGFGLLFFHCPLPPLHRFLL